MKIMIEADEVLLVFYVIEKIEIDAPSRRRVLKTYSTIVLYMLRSRHCSSRRPPARRVGPLFIALYAARWARIRFSYTTSARNGSCFCGGHTPFIYESFVWISGSFSVIQNFYVRQLGGHLFRKTREVTDVPAALKLVLITKPKRHRPVP